MIKKIVISILAFLLLSAGAAFYLFPRPGEVPVLMYHFIGSEQTAKKNKNFVSKKTFERQMAFLHWGGYHVISLSDLEATLKGTRKPQGREVAITFDDGHVSFLTEAFPVLNKYRFPVTLFIITGTLKEKPEDRLSEEMLRSLLRNDWIDIESHTQTHPHLSELSTEQIRAELAGSKKELEILFNRPVHFVAYPSGDIDGRVLGEAEKAGYHLAFSTSYKKLKGLPEGPYSMAREKISESSDNPVLFWTKTSGFYQSFKRYRHRVLHPSRSS